MASLGVLPVELLRIIGGHVYADAIANYAAHQSRHGAVYDLVSLTMTSRHFHGVFNPLLYQWDRGHGLYAMSWAINRHKPQTLQKIMAAGVDVDREVLDYSSGIKARPISIALESRSLDCLKLLLEYGANPDGPNVSDHPYRISDSSSALYLSQSQHVEDEEVALILLEHGARKYFRTPDAPEQMVSTTALHQAAACGHVKVVKHLLAEGEIEVDMPDRRGYTPFYHAAKRGEDTTAILQMLLEHGANRSGDPRMLEKALRGSHLGNAILLLCNQMDYSHQALHSYLYDLNCRLLKRMKTFPRDSLDEDVPRIISELIDLGADFNNARPPFFRNHDVPLLSISANKFDPFIFKTLVRFGANPLIKMQRINNSFNTLLDACVRTDVIEPVTGKTIFETAVDMCDDAVNPDTECLRYLLTQGPPSNLVSSHVYDVLDSRIIRMKEHLKGCIQIMQHGWISEKARAVVFDWMISYLPSRSVNKDGSAYSPSTTKSDKKAAKFFPWFLSRQQLDDLWDQGLAFYRRHTSIPSKQRWMTIPWLHINAERGDIEALRLLLGPSFPSLTPSKAEYPRDDGRPTPIMRAISAGHRDLATLLIREQIFWPRDTQGYCPHRESFSTGKSTCYVCPYGQRTTIELAFFQGEIELAEAILERVPDSGFSNPDWYDLPRVLSYGNAMAEWIQIRLPLNGYLEGGCMMQLYRQGDLHCETLKGLDQEMKELSKLRMEISEIRDAFIARAKSLKRERAV